MLTYLFFFFPLLMIGYFLLNYFCSPKVLNMYLLVTSFIMYFWIAEQFFFWILAFVFLTYLLGSVVYGAREDEKEKKKWVAIAVLVLISILAYYKYHDFIVENIKTIGLYKENSKMISVPIGISFIVFSAVSYVIDISRNEAEPGNFCDAALYLMLFPKLISGPIVTWKKYYPQIKDRRTDIDKIVSGIDQIIAGYAKKSNNSKFISNGSLPD